MNNKQTSQIPIREPLSGSTQPYYRYLIREGLAVSTSSEHVKNLERFLQWTKEQQVTTITTLTYNELLPYVQHLKTKQLSTNTVNNRINSIRKYYEHLKEIGKATYNPAKALYIKGAIKKIVHNPLTYAEQQALYTDYTHYLQTKPIQQAKQQLINQKYLVVLGLMLWQGIHSGALKKIEIQHINLKQGTIYIPGTARSNSRTLQLQAAQILPIHHYLHALPASQTHLISETTPGIIARIVQALQGLHPGLTSARHLRASVILHWLKLYGKREVQYMIGHKWISSTAHYDVQQLDGLRDLVRKHHPFG